MVVGKYCSCYIWGRNPPTRSKVTTMQAWEPADWGALGCVWTLPLVGTDGRTVVVSVDVESIDTVRGYWWRMTSDGYVAASVGHGKTALMHRLVMGECPDWRKPLIDHRNRVKSDNRKCNLKWVDARENALNTGLWAHNGSGVKGVRKTYAGTYQARIGQMQVGTYATLEAAVTARTSVLVAEYGPDGLRY